MADYDCGPLVSTSILNSVDSRLLIGVFEQTTQCRLLGGELRRTELNSGSAGSCCSVSIHAPTADLLCDFVQIEIAGEQHGERGGGFEL